MTNDAPNLACPLCGCPWQADKLDGLRRHVRTEHRSGQQLRVVNGVALLAPASVYDPGPLFDPGGSWESVGGLHEVAKGAR